MPLREKHSDIGEMAECFDNMSLKNFGFILGTSAA